MGWAWAIGKNWISTNTKRIEIPNAPAQTKQSTMVISNQICIIFFFNSSHPPEDASLRLTLGIDHYFLPTNNWAKPRGKHWFFSLILSFNDPSQNSRPYISFTDHKSKTYFVPKCSILGVFWTVLKPQWSKPSITTTLVGNGLLKG